MRTTTSTEPCFSIYNDNALILSGATDKLSFLFVAVNMVMKNYGKWPETKF